MFKPETNIPLYDSMLDDPAYFSENKGLQFKIIGMNPNDYYKACRKGFNGTHYVDGELVEKYRIDMKDGDKFPIPVLEYQTLYFGPEHPESHFRQEGYHRTVAAENFCKKIPVMIVYPANPEELQIHLKNMTPAVKKSIGVV